MSLTAVAVTFKTALEAYKKVEEISKKSAHLDLQGAILDLRQALLDAKEKSIELEEEVQNLRAQIAASKKKTDVRTKLEFRQEAYYFKEGESVDGYGPGPYCRTCMDVRNELVSVVRCSSSPLRRVIGNWTCGICHKNK